MSLVNNVNDSNFDDNLINADNLVILLFWAPWCSHCIPLITIFKEVSYEIPNAAFVTINKDEGAAIAHRFEIEYVPTILFFKNGKVEKKIIGAKRKEELKIIIGKLMQESLL